MWGAQKEDCPVCEGRTGGVCYSGYGKPGHDSAGFRCTACGSFEVSRTLLATTFAKGRNQLSNLQRASLSHNIRGRSNAGEDVLITTFWLDEFLPKARLPSKAEQSNNLLIAVGDHTHSTGDSFSCKDPELIALCGCLNDEKLKELMSDLYETGSLHKPLAYQEEEDNFTGAILAWKLSLTIGGEAEYERLKGVKDRRDGVQPSQKEGEPPLQTEAVQTLSHKVFIVHGHDEAAKHEMARFLETIGLKPIILHEQANGGKTIIEKIDHFGDCGFAVVLLTPDDVGGKAQDSLQPRARQNVILELGYFIGRLGRPRVAAFKRGSIEVPTDFAGVVYNEFDPQGAWKQLLARELEQADYNIDWNKVMR